MIRYPIRSVHQTAACRLYICAPSAGNAFGPPACRTRFRSAAADRRTKPLTAHQVRRCRLPVSQPVLKAPFGSQRLTETLFSANAFKVCFRFQLALLQPAGDDRKRQRNSTARGTRPPVDGDRRWETAVLRAAKQAAGS